MQEEKAGEKENEAKPQGELSFISEAELLTYHHLKHCMPVFHFDVKDKNVNLGNSRYKVFHS